MTAAERALAAPRTQHTVTFVPVEGEVKHGAQDAVLGEMTLTTMNAGGMGSNTQVMLQTGMLRGLVNFWASQHITPL